MMRLAALLICILSLPAKVGAEPADYQKRVKPLLATRCFACHGALKQQGALRLDTVASMIRVGESGAAVLPGKADASRLIERVRSADVDQRMPPEGEGAPLTAEEIAVLKTWIDQGAVGSADEKPEADPAEHWGFRAPTRPPLPQVRQTPERSRTKDANPIDLFIWAEQDRRGLTAQLPADRMLLLRRVTLDLIGLPPTAEELSAFAADQTADAYEQVVRRLLADPRYGERWGRHWMDVWRYSDWWGLGAEVRNSQKHMHHWRDWIVESLNEDVGYDEMIRQMLAADELYPDDPAKLRGTGYLARQYFKFNRNSWLDETVEHTGKAFLGLTLNCARCHDHKYDPIAQKDYYRLRAFFEPYQIRTDQVPGELNYDQDGMPRAFDCNLEAPTFLFRRGDDKRPVIDDPLTPGLPPVFALDRLNIESISLPPAAHQPGLRPWVLQNYLKSAEREISNAQEALANARRVLDEAERRIEESPAPLPETSPPAPIVQDDFTAEKPQWWKIDSGDWKYEGGRLTQSADGDVRGVLTLKPSPPADFQARFKYVTTGGKMWKSVGLSFDRAGENDVLVYLSCVSGGSKVQVSYKQNGTYLYPPESAHNRLIREGDVQDVIVRVRGSLLNIELNGEHVLAYRLPLERRQGALALITFDARADFQRFELAPLPKDYPLKAATGTKAATPPGVAEARAAVLLAESAATAAALQPDLIRARSAADQARFAASPPENLTEIIQSAVVAERRFNIAKAEQAVAQRKLELIKAEPPKKNEAEKNLASAQESLVKARAALEERSDSYTSLRGAQKTPESNLESGDSLQRAFPAKSSGRRTALARWMTDRRHPTTARVAVNHLWLRHMGAPLVSTVFDFGRKGAAPTHPQLLDWLAVELMEHNWSMKHLHRLMVMSETYQQSSSARGAEENRTIDPENRFYWRMNSTRMESEVVRDSLLHLSGELDSTRGGPSIPLASTGASKRRSLYFVHSHNEHSNLLAMFDDADVLDCYRRDQSIVPQQALALSNSKLSLETAAKIAASIRAEEDDEFIRRAFVLLLAAAPNAGEHAACSDAMVEWRRRGLPAERARANLIQALLNHNDFISIR